ncbi:hypothetical protein EDD17DRAFT_1804999 [Pisolithus thermaeus]|nr:hypothetical protein EDD17DRAFT_1804999 [Pisolithus thermaeus]
MQQKVQVGAGVGISYEPTVFGKIELGDFCKIMWAFQEFGEYISLPLSTPFSVVALSSLGWCTNRFSLLVSEGVDARSGTGVQYIDHSFPVMCTPRSTHAGKLLACAQYRRHKHSEDVSELLSGVFIQYILGSVTRYEPDAMGHAYQKPVIPETPSRYASIKKAGVPQPSLFVAPPPPHDAAPRDVHTSGLTYFYNVGQR